MKTTRVDQILAIQYLRGIAAMAVAVSHLSYGQAQFFKKYTPVLPELLGVWGVDVFFIISGFIMVYITADLQPGTSKARIFFLNRLIRIIPAYWFFTLVAFVLILFAHEVFHKIKPYGANELLASLLFVKVDAFPVLTVGWTLTFEMFFYVLFALSLMIIDQRFRVLFVAATLLLISQMHLIFYSDSPAVLFFSNPVILEFAIGVVLAWFYVNNIRLPSVFAMPILLLGFVLLLSSCFVYDGIFLLTYRALFWGLPAALIVWGALSLNHSVEFRPLGFLGNISYSVYLCHIPVMVALAMALKKFLPTEMNPNIFLVMFAFPLVILVSYISHKIIEVELSQWLRKHF